MPIKVLLELQIQPDQVEALKELLGGALPDSRAFDGCIKLEVAQNQNDPTNVVVVQEWQSKEHQQRYSRWRYETGFLDKMGALLAARPSLRYFDLLDI